MVKRVLVRSGLVAAVAALAFAAPSQAGIKAVCVIDGETKMGTKISEGGPPVPWVQIVGGKGTFTYASVSVVCAGDDGKGLPVIDVVEADASGTFRNTICGTAKVLGIVTRVSSVNPKYQAFVGKKFGYEPVNFEGGFFWHSWDKPSTLPKIWPDDDPNKPNQFGPKDYGYAGELLLSLSHTKIPLIDLPDVTINKCTKAFHVDGTVVIHDK